MILARSGARLCTLSSVHCEGHESTSAVVGLADLTTLVTVSSDTGLKMLNMIITGAIISFK